MNLLNFLFQLSSFLCPLLLFSVNVVVVVVAAAVVVVVEDL